MWTRAEWKEESATASRAIKLESKGIGHRTPLQRALVLHTMASNLKAFIDERSQADAILMKADPSLGQSHIADYPEGISEEMQYCKGWYWEPRTNGPPTPRRDMLPIECREVCVLSSRSLHREEGLSRPMCCRPT